jgi:hypothetical protein
MHHFRIAAFLLGCWLLGSLFITFVATENFNIVDAVLSSPPPEASKMIQTLGDQNARQLLRYLAGEENRGFFQDWELAQLALGTALVGFLLFGIEKRLLAVLAGAMLILTLFQHFKITPELDWTGRSIDFAPRGVASARSVLETARHLQRNRSGKDAAGRDHCWLSISDAPPAVTPASRDRSGRLREPPKVRCVTTRRTSLVAIELLGVSRTTAGLEFIKNPVNYRVSTSVRVPGQID